MRTGYSFQRHQPSLLRTRRRGDNSRHGLRWLQVRIGFNITLCIIEDKKVGWVIREKGNGPCVMGGVKTLGGRVHAAWQARKVWAVLTPSYSQPNVFAIDFFIVGRADWAFVSCKGHGGKPARCHFRWSGIKRAAKTRRS
jgi:hypothetical protein